MAELGTTFRVVYAAKNFATGVTGVVCNVRLPDNTNDPGNPFALSAMPSPYDGLYFFDYSTGLGDPEGVYTFHISSPNEDSHKAAQTENFLLPSGGGGGGLTLDEVRDLINSALGRENIEVIAQDDQEFIVEVEADEDQEIQTQTDTEVTVEVESDDDQEVLKEADQEIIVEVNDD